MLFTYFTVFSFIQIRACTLVAISCNLIQYTTTSILTWQIQTGSTARLQANDVYGLITLYNFCYYLKINDFVEGFPHQCVSSMVLYLYLIHLSLYKSQISRSKESKVIRTGIREHVQRCFNSSKNTGI